MIIACDAEEHRHHVAADRPVFPSPSPSLQLPPFYRGNVSVCKARISSPCGSQFFTFTCTLICLTLGHTTSIQSHKLDFRIFTCDSITLAGSVRSKYLLDTSWEDLHGGCNVSLAVWPSVMVAGVQRLLTLKHIASNPDPGHTLDVFCEMTALRSFSWWAHAVKSIGTRWVFS